MTDKPITLKTSPITSHVLDTSSGKPAAKVTVNLSKFIDEKWIPVNESQTNEDGRCNDLAIAENISPGRYRVRFLLKSYFEALKVKSMYPYVDIVFEIEDPQEHYHIPLLISPFGYTTYRGS